MLNALRPACLVTVSLFAHALPVAAQHSFAYEYDETSEEVAELPPAVALDALTAYEKTQIAYTGQETSHVVFGYDERRGLHRERLIEEPLANMPTWKRNVPARYAFDRDGERVYNEHDRLVSNHPRADADEEYGAMSAAAYRGEIKPYRMAIYPTAEMLESLEREGFVRVRPLNKRSLKHDQRTTRRLDGTQYGFAPALELSDGRQVIAFDTINKLEVNTILNDRGGVALQYVNQYSAFTLTSGEVGYFETGRIEVRPDSLLNGAVVSRTRLWRRSALSYTVDGEQQLTRATTLSGDISVYPNPVISGRVQILLPTTVTGVATVELHDATGQLVHRRDYGSTPAGTIIADLPSDLQAGVYSLSVGIGLNSWTRFVVAQ